MEEDKVKILISSPCRLTGTFDLERFKLFHAWPAFIDPRTPRPNADLEKAAYLVEITLEDNDPNKNYMKLGDHICAVLSVLYGKLFDNHGLIQTFKYYNLPNTQSFYDVRDHLAPWNCNKPRANIPVELELPKFNNLWPIFENDSAFSHKFIGLSMFYFQALQMVERDYQMAYMSLITAGEMLAHTFELDDHKDFQESIDTAKKLIKSADGISTDHKNFICSSLKNTEKRITQKYVQRILSLLKDDFFEKSDLSDGPFKITPENIEGLIKKTYRVRSEYLHSGEELDSLYGIRQRLGEVHPNSGAATFYGLEKLMRYAILKYAEENGFKVTV